MPVEIKELVIRMSAQGTSEKQETTDTAPATNTPSTGQLNQEAIVEACVKQVLTILERKKKR